MKPIRLIRLSDRERSSAEPDGFQLERVAAALTAAFCVPCEIERRMLDISFALDAERLQYWSTAILQRLQNDWNTAERLLGVTSCDLYVPALTFVFGEAQLEGNCALVSTARLREEFYGMPSQERLERERLIKEAVHELGHTFGLRHCGNWRCVMSSSHAVERLDIKEAQFCVACQRAVLGNGQI